MLPHEIPGFLARSPQQEDFEVRQLSHEFYRELEYRQEKERYCQWYHQVATQHQQEFRKLKRDPYFLNWFLRRS
jgi:hypothetical protein